MDIHGLLQGPVFELLSKKLETHRSSSKCEDGKVLCEGVLPWSGVTSDESLALLLFASGAEASCVLRDLESCTISKQHDASTSTSN